jgi:hypothetical protein
MFTVLTHAQARKYTQALPFEQKPKHQCKHTTALATLTKTVGSQLSSLLLVELKDGPVRFPDEVGLPSAAGCT